MKTIIALFALLLIITAGIYFSQNYLKNNPFTFNQNKEITIGKQTFKVAVAKTNEEKQIGLSKKTSLADNEGMFFPFEKEDFYSFWMKNMKMPIDIIYINKNKITTIYSDIKPPKDANENLLTIYKPEEPSDSVLEIKAGLSKKYGFEKGDEVKVK
ncbi:MAG: DUF192 domain-containing protein [bacterium]|nr:DUF192 domain-containing protein [bacterium]